MTQHAYGEAYQHGFRRTVRLLRSRGATLANAEDVAQNAWMQGWQKLHQLRDEGTIVSWINVIALNFHRRGSQLDARYQPLPELLSCNGIDSTPLDAAKVLKVCRPADRILFEQQLDGLTNQEIARKQGVSDTAIRIRFTRARRIVRAALDVRLPEVAPSPGAAAERLSI